MKIQKLGHVVLRVASLERMTDFYRDILGLEVIPTENPAFVFFTIPGDHHLMALKEGLVDLAPNRLSISTLHHFAFKVGDGVETIEAVAKELEEIGVVFKREDNSFTQTVVFDDPEGNTIELYADIRPAPWQQPLARAETFQEVAMRAAGPHHLK